MPVTIKVNGVTNSLVHKMSNGISSATIPDVCKTPSPGGPVPIPYPNISQSITLASGTTTVKADKMMAAVKGSKFSLSNGDQAGTVGGVKSNVFMKESTWILYSFDVKMNGKNACRLSDKMFHNNENAANLQGETQGPAGGGESKDTGSHSKALGKDLEKAGYSRPGKDYQAAHIVPTNSFRNRSKAVQEAIATAQSKFDEFVGPLRRDTNINGFWAEAGHAGTHTDRYFLALGRAFENVNSAADGKRVIGNIWRRIRGGSFLS